MKKNLSTVLIILIVIICILFAVMGKFFIDLKNSHEVAIQTIEILRMERNELSKSLTKAEKDKEDLKQQIKNLTVEKIELENKVKELSIQKINTLAEQENIEKKEEVSLSSSTTNNTTKKAYLTFDDGPSANTEQILDILKKYNIKATFFVTGNSSNKELYRRIVNEGHAIGNHTYSHNYKSIYSSVDAFMEDLERLNKFLEETTGVRPDIVRIPGGSNNQVSKKYGGEDIMEKIVKKVVEEGYQYFDWNVTSTDAEKVKQDKEVIVEAVLKGTKDKTNAVILMHDSAPKTTTVEALPEIIEGLIQQGYKFDTLDKNSYAPHFLKVD